MFKDYLYNGKDKFKISKVSTNETSLCKDKEDALEKMAQLRMFYNVYHLMEYMKQLLRHLLLQN